MPNVSDAPYPVKYDVEEIPRYQSEIVVCRRSEISIFGAQAAIVLARFRDLHHEKSRGKLSVNPRFKDYLVRSYEQLSQDTGLSYAAVRHAVRILKKTGKVDAMLRLYRGHPILHFRLSQEQQAVSSEFAEGGIYHASRRASR